jgi:hypothetical protein
MKLSMTMRNVTHLVAVVCLIMATTGCPKRQPRPVTPPAAERKTVRAAPSQFGAGPSRVSFVSTEHQFVVIDLLSRTIPAVGTRLKVFHGDKQVGTVQITEPMRARFATADIIEGEPKVGDEAR